MYVFQLSLSVDTFDLSGRVTCWSAGFFPSASSLCSLRAIVSLSRAAEQFISLFKSWRLSFHGNLTHLNFQYFLIGPSCCYSAQCLFAIFIFLPLFSLGYTPLWFNQWMSRCALVTMCVWSMVWWVKCKDTLWCLCVLHGLISEYRGTLWCLCVLHGFMNEYWGMLWCLCCSIIFLLYCALTAPWPKEPTHLPLSLPSTVQSASLVSHRREHILSLESLTAHWLPSGAGLGDVPVPSFGRFLGSYVWCELWQLLLMLTLPQGTCSGAQGLSILPRRAPGTQTCTASWHLISVDEFIDASWQEVAVLRVWVQVGQDEGDQGWTDVQVWNMAWPGMRVDSSGVES